MNDYPWYGGTPPHVRDSTTSKAAAVRAEPKARTQRQRVYAYLRHAPTGATDEQMQDALAMNPNTQRPRRIELVQAGSVRDSGRRQKTRSNRDAVVWIAELPEPIQQELLP